MATDRLGNAVSTGGIYVLAGVARRVDGDDVLLVHGANAGHATRVAAGDVVRVDDLCSTASLAAAISALASSYQALNETLTALGAAGDGAEVGSIFVLESDGWTVRPPGNEGDVLQIISGIPTYAPPGGG